MIKGFGIKFVTGLLLCLVSLSVLAVECEEVSPNLKQDEDLYFDIVGAESLTRTQSSRIKKLLKLIGGRWQGVGTRAYCVENKKRVFSYKLKADVEQNSDGKLIFRVNSLENQTKSLRDETFKFLGAGNQYHITKLTEDSIGLYTKYRRPNANRKTTVLIEEIVEINGDKKSLNLNITQYLNGYFAEQFSRQFSR